MKRLRSNCQYAGYSLAVIALIFQLLAIIVAWWNSDPRITCDRLPGWREWVSCLHGLSHLHVWFIEASVAAWAIAGLALVSGRRFPSYVSALLPLMMAGFFAFGTGLYWKNNVVPYMNFGEATHQQLVDFAVVEGLVLVILVFPVVGSWLLGLIDRHHAAGLDRSMRD
jgi:hypothetical protein